MIYPITKFYINFDNLGEKDFDNNTYEYLFSEINNPYFAWTDENNNLDTIKYNCKVLDRFDDNFSKIINNLSPTDKVNKKTKLYLSDISEQSDLSDLLYRKLYIEVTVINSSNEKISKTTDGFIIIKKNINEYDIDNSISVSDFEINGNRYFLKDECNGIYENSSKLNVDSLISLKWRTSSYFNKVNIKINLNGNNEKEFIIYSNNKYIKKSFNFYTCNFNPYKIFKYLDNSIEYNGNNIYSFKIELIDESISNSPKKSKTFECKNIASETFDISAKSINKILFAKKINPLVYNADDNDLIEEYCSIYSYNDSSSNLISSTNSVYFNQTKNTKKFYTKILYKNR